MLVRYRLIFIYSFLLMVACLQPLSANGESLSLEQPVKELNPFIQSVSLCGRWRYGKEEGQFRVIVGWLWGHSEIYIQWLADPVWYPEPGQEERRVPLVLKTVSFEEFNYYESATDLEQVSCKKTGKSWLVTAIAEDAQEDPPVRSKVHIHLFNEPGKYRITVKEIGKRTDRDQP